VAERNARENPNEMTNGAERHDVVVIGAGQAGLAAGYYLARAGIDYQVLEAGRRIGDVWRNRYESLRLYSPASGDALPGLRFPMSGNGFPSGRQMGDYLEAYADHHGLAVRTDARVEGLRAAAVGGGAGFEIALGDERMLAGQVIVATGAFQRPSMPDFATELDPGIRQLHAADYRRPEQLAPGPVLVVGLSHSGADLAWEAVRSGRSTILSGAAHGELPFPIDSRRGRYIAWPLMRFLGSRVLTLSTPIGRRMAPKVRMGGGPLLRVRRSDLRAAGVDLREQRTVGVKDGKPQLADGSVLQVANVIWCTGYRADYSWIDLPITYAQGWPEQSRGVVESVPGLYIMGVPFLYAFASMLIAGAPRDARYIVERVASRAAAADERARTEQGSAAA
jgi:putative flavoprotein involved in K+ transport